MRWHSGASTTRRRPGGARRRCPRRSRCISRSRPPGGRSACSGCRSPIRATFATRAPASAGGAGRADRRRARAPGAGRAEPRVRGRDRSRAPADGAPELAVARHADAARLHRGRREHAAAGRGARSDRPARARRRDRPGIPPHGPARRQPARHDPGRVRHPPGAEGVAAAARRRGRGAPPHRGAAARPPRRAPTSRPTCRWCPWTRSCWSRCSSTCWRTPPSTRPPGRRSRSAPRRGRTRSIAYVADRGPGLPAGGEETVFQKFYRGGAASGGHRPRAHHLPRHRHRARRAHLGGAPARRRNGLQALAPHHRHRHRNCSPRTHGAPCPAHPPDRGRAADAAVPADRPHRARLPAHRGGNGQGGPCARDGAESRCHTARPRPARSRWARRDPRAPRVEHHADHRALGARARAGQGRRARPRRRRLPHQAVRGRRSCSPGSGSRCATP